jgi:hypothetical protein
LIEAVVDGVDAGVAAAQQLVELFVASREGPAREAPDGFEAVRESWFGGDGTA